MVIFGLSVFFMMFSVFTVLLDDRDPDEFWDGFWKAVFMAAVFTSGAIGS